jgi:hypothetical protein
MWLIRKGQQIWVLEPWGRLYPRKQSADKLYSKEEVAVDPVGALGHTNREKTALTPMSNKGALIPADMCQRGYIGFANSCGDVPPQILFVDYSQAEYLD